MAQTLLQRNTELAKRCRDLSPLAVPIRDRIWEGNRQTVLAGVSPGTTTPVAPLRPSTLERRKGTGPPRAPEGASSKVISGCEVSVVASTGRLSFTKSYPSLGEVAVYLNYGTRRMAARPFFEFRKIDLEWINGQLRNYVIQPSGFFGRLFGG